MLLHNAFSAVMLLNTAASSFAAPLHSAPTRADLESPSFSFWPARHSHSVSAVHPDLTGGLDDPADSAVAHHRPNAHANAPERKKPERKKPQPTCFQAAILEIKKEPTKAILTTAAIALGAATLGLKLGNVFRRDLDETQHMLD